MDAYQSGGGLCAAAGSGQILAINNNGLTMAAGSITIASGGKLILPSPPAPASATAAGSTGEIAWDSSYIYVCVSTNTWKRAALSTW